MDGLDRQRLADETRRVLAAHGWSQRRAEIQTGVGKSTIANMALGIRPRPDAIVAWARAIGEDENDWLEWAGYPELVRRFGGGRSDAPQEAAGATDSPPDAADGLSDEERAVLAQMEDEAMREAIGYLAGMPASDRKRWAATLRAWKAAQEEE